MHPDIKHCAMPTYDSPKHSLVFALSLAWYVREQWSPQLLDWHYHGMNFRQVMVTLFSQSSPSRTIT